MPGSRVQVEEAISITVDGAIGGRVVHTQPGQAKSIAMSTLRGNNVCEVSLSIRVSVFLCSLKYLLSACSESAQTNYFEKNVLSH